MGSGSKPGVYHKAVPVAKSSARFRLPYQFSSCRRQDVVGSDNRVFKEVWRGPFLGFLPRLPLGCGNGLSYSAASSRSRETYTIPTRSAAHCNPSFTAARPPSTTNTSARVGNQRRTASIICRIQSILVLCRRPHALSVFSDGAKTVKNGSAHTRPLNGISTSSIRLTQRNP